MSQFYTSVAAANVPTSFVTDSGTAVPAANVININGANGISTSGSGNSITITLKENTLTGTATTTDGSTIPLITFTPTNGKAFAIQGLVIGYDAINNLTIGGEVIGVGRASGGVTMVPPAINSIIADPLLDSATFFLAGSGSNVVLNVQGIVGHTITWSGILNINQSP